MKSGNLYVMEECKNTIREIQRYVWDPKSAKMGYDEPLKKDDHSVDALRYVMASHKVNSYKMNSQTSGHNTQDYFRDRFTPTRRV
jgi:phage terminase large subunit